MKNPFKLAPYIGYRKCSFAVRDLTLTSLLIQIHQRHRELSILKSLGISRFQLFRLLMTEGLIIGLIGAAMSLLLGTALGFVCIAFLDQFTLFEYHYIWSFQSSLSITLFAVLTCCLSAIYPALAANKPMKSDSNEKFPKGYWVCWF